MLYYVQASMYLHNREMLKLYLNAIMLRNSKDTRFVSCETGLMPGMTMVATAMVAVVNSMIAKALKHIIMLFLL